MKLWYLFLCLLLINDSLSNPNLIKDPGFETFKDKLTLLYNQGVQEFSYALFENGQTEWYSDISGSVKIRTTRNPPTVSIQTLNNNMYNKICRNITQTSFSPTHPFQLSFNYFIDGNIFSSIFSVTWNNQLLLYSQVSNREPYLHNSTVSVHPHNTLCLQGWSSPQSTPLGTLITNISLVPYIFQSVSLDIVPSLQYDVPNVFTLRTNWTTTTFDQGGQGEQGERVQIGGDSCREIGTGVDDDGKLFFIVQVQRQYYAGDRVVLTLPDTRNQFGQVVRYVSIETYMPLFLYQSQYHEQLLQALSKYITEINKIYQIIFIIIRSVSFVFVGLKFSLIRVIFNYLWMAGFQFVLPSAKKIIDSSVKMTVNPGIINFFATFTTNEQRINFGVNQDNWVHNNIVFQNFQLNSNLYIMLIDNLIFAILNIVKVFIFHNYIFKQKSQIKRLLGQIKKQRIMLEFLYVLPIVAFLLSFSIVNSFSIDFFSAKINQFFCILLPIFIIMISCYVYLYQNSKLYRNLKVIKLRHLFGNINQKKNNYYRNQSLVNFLENCSFFVVPFLAGIGCSYLALFGAFFICLFKIVLEIKCFQYKINLINFLYIISSIILLVLICSLLCIQIFKSSTPTSASSQNWFNFLRTNSYIVIFALLISETIELAISLYCFVDGCYLLLSQTICKAKESAPEQYKFKFSQQLDENELNISEKETQSKTDVEMEMSNHSNFSNSNTSSSSSSSSLKNFNISDMWRNEQLLQNPFIVGQTQPPPPPKKLSQIGNTLARKSPGPPSQGTVGGKNRRKKCVKIWPSPLGQIVELSGEHSESVEEHFG